MDDNFEQYFLQALPEALSERDRRIHGATLWGWAGSYHIPAHPLSLDLKARRLPDLVHAQAEAEGKQLREAHQIIKRQLRRGMRDLGRASSSAGRLLYLTISGA